MSARSQRRADLLAARQRIDAELVRLAQSPADIPTDPPPLSMSLERTRAIARQMIWNGSTHAEVAVYLDIHTDLVGPLIAVRADRLRVAP